MQLTRAIVAACSLTAAGAAVSCSTVSSDARIGVVAPDDSEQTFGPVADYLDHRCGSLDCHGQTGRNLRIWGCEGMRLDPSNTPQCSRLLGGTATTPAEHEETFRSLVGLEPTVMSVVVANQGQDAELLTFVRKARGTEAHKGGTLVVPGDPQDVCITSWLQGSTSAQACASAIGVPRFPALDASTP